MRQIAPSHPQATDLRSRDRAFLWPFFETRLFWAALGHHWKRILVGALVGWVVAVVAGAVILAALEYQGVVSRSTSDGLGTAIVLGGTALGALTAYALRPAPASTRPRVHPRSVRRTRRRPEDCPGFQRSPGDDPPSTRQYTPASTARNPSPTRNRRGDATSSEIASSEPLTSHFRPQSAPQRREQESIRSKAEGQGFEPWRRLHA